jgi:NNP family nitrate/nitrite transporter-like MFS transporter
MLLSAISAYLTSLAEGFWSFFVSGLGFGIAGASFAVGVAYTSVWFTRERQGTALGVFGSGTAGAALTAMFAPRLLVWLTHDGQALERWRLLPPLYAGLLVVTCVVYLLLTTNRRATEAGTRTMRQRLAPLRSVRVWRFGLYYFLLFGGFVSLAQWLIPYYVNVYSMSVATAGLLSAGYSLPSGAFRALGGWLSDRFGARAVMYVVLSVCAAGFLMLAVPRMEIQSPGEGVLAKRAGTVSAVRETLIEVDGVGYPLRPHDVIEQTGEVTGHLFLPVRTRWQQPTVRPGDRVAKGALLARGITDIYFQANILVFTSLVFVVALFMGIGMAAVYKHIPTYFPQDVGTVGGLVGVIGGLGGFISPILFGYLLQWTGIWTSNWVLLLGLSLVSLTWMHLVIRRMMNVRAPEVVTQIDETGPVFPLALRVRCPVHDVEARVHLMVSPKPDRTHLDGCSLYPGQGSPPCEGRCVVTGTAPLGSAEVAS